MIPKIIHYCWFGNGEQSDKIKFCINTWKKILPDYEIKEWSDKDLHLFTDNKYVKEAYNAKKWAFVSDVFRLYALYTYGGIYFDTDVEVRKSFDNFLNHDFFIGAEKLKNSYNLGTAVIGAQKNNKIIKNMLDIYINKSFIKSDGSFDMTANPILLNEIMKQYGVSDDIYKNLDTCEFYDNSVIYPYTYFCTDNSFCYSVHHFEGSWIPDYILKKKITIKIGRNYSLVFYKYKKLKNNDFVYPITIKKKIFDIDFNKKKFLITLESNI